MGAAFTDDGFAMGKDSMHGVYMAENESYTVSLEFFVFFIFFSNWCRKRDWKKNQIYHLRIIFFIASLLVSLVKNLMNIWGGNLNVF